MAFLGLTTSKSKNKEKDKSKKLKRENEFLRSQPATIPTREENQELRQRTDEFSDEEDKRIGDKREQFREETLRDISTDIPGLTSKHRQALQETANKQIGGQLENYSRMLASQQGARGVRGGKAQAGLRRASLDASNQFMRDLTDKDAQLAMQKLGAYLTGVEGKTAQDILQRQQYQDYLTGEQERRRREKYDQYFNKYFNRI